MTDLADGRSFLSILVAHLTVVTINECRSASSLVSLWTLAGS